MRMEESGWTREGGGISGHQPICQSAFDALQSLRRNLADGPEKHALFRDGQSANSNQACCLEPARWIVGVVLSNYIVEPRDLEANLRGHHADEPIAESARQLANDQGRTELARIQVTLGKPKEHYLAWPHH